MTEIFTIILSILASIISGMVLFLLKRYFDKKEERDKEKGEVLARENILILKSINALGKLTQANAIALKNGKTNGEMEEAMSEYEKIDKELFEYLLEQNSVK
jgi:hypothetical protein